MAIHSIVRLDEMFGTENRTGLVAVRYLGADGETPTAIDNGHVLAVGALVEGEREVYVGAVPTADTALNKVVLVACPEVPYDERDRDLEDYYNEAGKNLRGYTFHVGSYFSVTADALTGTKAVGDIVELAAATTLNTVKSATGATKIGEIVAIEAAGKYTFYVVKVG